MRGDMMNSHLIEQIGRFAAPYAATAAILSPSTTAAVYSQE
jgi:hypothetical protein